MDIKDILAKISKGEAFSDEERAEVGKIDWQKIIDDNAASARRKAVEEAKTAKARVVELEAKVQELQDAATKDGIDKAGDIAKLTKQVEKLTASVEAANAERDALKRSQGIAEIMSSASIKAAQGVADKGLRLLFETALGKTALDDEEAVKAVVEQFKKDYGGMIAAGGSSAPRSGDPSSGQWSSANNPFKTGNLTQQAELFAANPEQARALQAEAEAASGKSTT